MSELYTVAEASKLTGIAKPTLRAYTNRYARFLSTEATPEQGAERNFTESDLKVLAFVYAFTSAGKTHDQAIEALSAGELESFDWQPPEPEPESQQSAESTGEALVPASRLQAAQVLVQDAQERERAAQEQISALQARIEHLSQELGKAQGELAGFHRAQYRAPAWWRSLFGGRSE